MTLQTQSAMAFEISAPHFESNHYIKQSTHIKHVLSELLWFDAGQHPEQQVHDGRRPDVFDNQVYKILPLPQKLYNLKNNACTQTHIEQQKGQVYMVYLHPNSLHDL